MEEVWCMVSEVAPSGKVGCESVATTQNRKANAVQSDGLNIVVNTQISASQRHVKRLFKVSPAAIHYFLPLPAASRHAGRVSGGAALRRKMRKFRCGRLKLELSASCQDKM